MSVRMTDEEAKALAHGIMTSEGNLTVRRLAKEVGGDTGWLSRIVREVKSLGAKAEKGEEEVRPDLPLNVPVRVREAVAVLERATICEIQRAISEHAARSRSAEDVLRLEHDRVRSELEHELAQALEQMRELEEIASELGADIQGARERADELERTLHGERERHAEQVKRLQEDVRSVAAAERRSAEARHAAEVNQARAEAEHRAASAGLERERAGRRTVEDRLATVEASRSTLHHQLQTVKAQLIDSQRSLEAERATARRLEKLVGEHLGDSVTDAKPRRRGKPAAKTAAQ